mmetsp:Transcript_17021/g.39268  ORF Transcript_17021/g.39268 Transcript_17021/m.39268 type:complete len:1209 (+) Transcript_17021:165-3791(+)
MFTTENGYIIDVTDEEGVAIIPAPPSPMAVVDDTVASAASSLPSRASVSAAIALVRAKQVAKSAILKAEEQILKPLSVSSDKASASAATDPYTKEKLSSSIEETAEIENAAPLISLNGDRSFSSAKAPSGSSTASGKITSSSYSDVHELPQKPSLDESCTNQAIDTTTLTSDDIPEPPSMDTCDEATTVASTIDDVNAILSRLGVGEFQSSNNQIDMLRMLSSSSSGVSADGIERSVASKREPESADSRIIVADKEKDIELSCKTGASISIKNSAESETGADNEDVAEEKGCTPQLEKSSEYPVERVANHRDDPPPSTFALETQNHPADPPGPSHLSEAVKTVNHGTRENPFIDHSFSNESLENSALSTPTAAIVEDKENDDEKNVEVVYEEETKKQMADNPFAVRKALSTVEEVVSVEAENEYCNEDDNRRLSNNTENIDDTQSTLKQVTSNEQESVYGSDGRKEPGGLYKNVGVAVEKIPVANIGVEQSIENAMSLMSTDSHQVGFERDGSSVKKKEDIHDSLSSGGSRGFSETGSHPWALRDVASEETLRATGRRRPQFVVSGPRPPNKARNTVSLFDDISHQASETASEYHKNASILPEDLSAGCKSLQNNERTENETPGSTADADTADDVEVSRKVEEDATAKPAVATPTSNEPSNSFIRQFEDLGVHDDQEIDGQFALKTPVSSPSNISEDESFDLTSPKRLYNYFCNIEQYIVEGESEEKLVEDFKIFITPVVQGHKPTVIEEAQIRQAALKANISLDYVDAFVDFVKDDNPELLQCVSKEVKPVSWGGTDEDLDEDDAIAAFLSSTASSSEYLEEREEESHKNRVESSDTKKTCEKETSSSRSFDYQASITSTVDNDSTFDEEYFNSAGEDSGVKSEFISNEGSDGDGSTREESRSETSDRDGLEESVVSEDETIDIEMLKGCQSIESYDEDIWQRRSAMAAYGWGWEGATWLSPKASSGSPMIPRDGIDRVIALNDSSNFLFNRKSFPLTRKRCKLSYDRRVKSHTGYFDVDVYSLQESAAVGQENQFRDETPWELRRVRQKFLHERSISFSRNWFGNLVKTSGNDKVKAPICKPKSMEMPMPKIPDPGDWTPEWYTTWGGRKGLMQKPTSESSVESGSISDSSTEKEYNDEDSLRSFTSGSSYDDDEDHDEDAPECGTFVNTKQKIGEHVSRVHPDYTSSLRKSRWRKKYFPIGTFPY